MLKKLLLSAVMALGLSACASTSSDLLSPGLLPPDSLYPTTMTDCTKFDPGPARKDKTKPRTDKEKAKLVAGLYDAYKDCKTTVEGWKERRDDYVKQYENQTYNGPERIWREITGKAKKD